MPTPRGILLWLRSHMMNEQNDAVNSCSYSNFAEDNCFIVPPPCNDYKANMLVGWLIRV